MSTLQALFAADLRDDLSRASVERALQENAEALPQDDEDRAFTQTLVRGVSAKREEIDRVIERAAPQWPLAKIACIDRNILRIGLYELLYGAETSVPPKVALNESIELAKTFGGDASSRFVNGVLGSVYRELGSPRKDEAPRGAKEFFAGVVVCARDGEALVVALVKDAFDTWTLPKTQYQPGELSDSAAARAGQELLGLKKIELKAPLSEHEYEAHEPERGVVMRRVGYFVACTKKTPLRVPAGKSLTEAKWFTLEDMAGAPVYEDLRAIIESGMVVAKGHCV